MKPEICALDFVLTKAEFLQTRLIGVFEKRIVKLSINACLI